MGFSALQGLSSLTFFPHVTVIPMDVRNLPVGEMTRGMASDGLLCCRPGDPSGICVGFKALGVKNLFNRGARLIT